MDNKTVIINAGINGNNSAELLQRIHRDVFGHQPQLVVLMVGTNDMLNGNNRLSLQEYETNYQMLIDTIVPRSELIIMTIPPVNDAYIIHRDLVFSNTSIGPDEKVQAANRIIRKLADLNQISLVDLYRILSACGGSTELNECLFRNESNVGIADGVHPTEAGYRVIAAAVFQCIQAVMPRAEKIVCFGDSITFGYEVEGRGTNTGDCYPGILQRIFD